MVGNLVSETEQRLRAAELRSRVAEHLMAGESYVAGTWVCRAMTRPSPGRIAAAELNPKRLAEALAWEAFGVDAAAGPDTYGSGREGLVVGAAGSRAAALDRHIPNETTPRALAISDRRLLLLAKTTSAQRLTSSAHHWVRSLLKEARDLVRNRQTNTPVPPLALLWQCARSDLSLVSADGGRLSLNFVDGSSLTVVTPAILAVEFASRGGHLGERRT